MNHCGSEERACLVLYSITSVVASLTSRAGSALEIVFEPGREETQILECRYATGDLHVRCDFEGREVQ